MYLDKLKLYVKAEFQEHKFVLKFHEKGTKTY